MPLNTLSPSAAGHLCRCLRGALGQHVSRADLPVSEDQWARVLRISGEHLVTTSLCWALREGSELYHELPQDVSDYLDAVYALNVERNVSCQDQLGEVAAVLNTLDIRPVLLKGAAVLAAGIYPSCGERMIGDLDILVPSERLAEVVSSMARLGYRSGIGETESVVRWDPERLSRKHHYPALVHPERPTSIELHVRPVVFHHRDLLSSEDVLDGARPISLRGADCLLPGPDAMVIHNVVHAFLFDTRDCMKRISLRQLLEFALFCQTYLDVVDWDRIEQRFASRGFRKQLIEYVVAARVCFGVELARCSGAFASHRVSPRLGLDLFRLEIENRAAWWLANMCCQLIQRTKSVVREPTRIRRLSDRGFYRTLGESIWPRGGKSRER